MWDAIIDTDRELFLFLNSMGQAPWDDFWLLLSDKWAAIPIYAVLLIGAYRRFGLRGTGLLLLSVALLITCSDQLANFFKYGVGRLRPCHDPELEGLVRLVKASCGGRFGYFSAHAANSFGLATFFVCIWGSGQRIWKYLLLIWALLVGYSRIYLGVHYPLDVASGFLVGGFFGWVFSHLFQMAHKKWVA